MAALNVEAGRPAVRRTEQVLRPLFPWLAAASIVLVAACSQNGARPPVITPSTPAQPQAGSTSAPTHVDPALSSFVDRAVADLARRRDVSPSEIVVLEARAIVWPDGSLGCPRPGMEYTQMLQEGVLIRLQLGDRTYAYHGGGSRLPELCEAPSLGPTASAQPRSTCWMTASCSTTSR